MTHAATAAYREIIDHAGHLPAVEETGDFAGTPPPPGLQGWAAGQLAGSAEPLLALVRRGVGRCEAGGLPPTA